MTRIGRLRAWAAALLVAALAAAVGVGASVAVSAPSTSSPTIAIFTIPSGDYATAFGRPVLPITAIAPAPGSSQDEFLILTSASGTSVLREPVTGGLPSVTPIGLGSPAGGYPAMVAADGLDWAVSDYDGTNGGLYAIDRSGTTTRVATPGYDPSTNEQGAALQDMTVGPDGNLYITDSGLGYVYQCTISASPSPSGSCTPTPNAVCGGSAIPYFYSCNGPTNGTQPKSIASASGKLWINDQNRNVASMTTTGTFAGPYAQSGGAGNASYSSRTLIAADGFLWSTGGFVDGSESSEILKIDPATASVVATFQVGQAWALTADTSGNIWYVGQGAAGDGVGELDPVTGAITFTAAPAGSFAPYPPGALASDPAGGEAIAPGPAGSNTLFFDGQDGSGAPIVGEVRLPATTTTTTTTPTTTTSAATVRGTVVAPAFPTKLPVLNRPYPVLPPQLTLSGPTARFSSGETVTCDARGKACTVSVVATALIGRRTVTLGSHHAILKPGASATPRLRLRRSRLVRLLRHRRTKIRIRVTISRRGTAPQTSTVQLTFGGG